MAITNNEIIDGEAILHGIEEPLHTYAKWKSMGYIVKKVNTD